MIDDARSWLFWLGLAGEITAGAAFMAVFVAMVFVLIRRRDFRVSLLLPAFAFSILACGAAFLLSAIDRFAGIEAAVVGAKLAAAIVAVPVALLAWPIVWQLARVPDNEIENL